MAVAFRTTALVFAKGVNSTIWNVCWKFWVQWWECAIML